MSGPIVRKYGFPNFEKIFGERELQHGVDEDEGAAAGEEPDAAPKKKSPAKAKEKSTGEKKGKKKS